MENRGPGSSIGSGRTSHPWRLASIQLDKSWVNEIVFMALASIIPKSHKEEELPLTLL